jgi:hypothetical protein
MSRFAEGKGDLKLEIGDLNPISEVTNDVKAVVRSFPERRPGKHERGVSSHPFVSFTKGEH